MKADTTFFKTLEEVRRIVADGRYTPAGLERLRAPLLDSDVRREFFSSLNEPSWAVPLRDAGYFRSPPQPSHGEGGLRHPVWPEGQYLARVAAAIPAEAASILAGLDTANLSVVGNILDAAIAMPAAVAATLVPTIEQAARTGTLWLHFKDAADLCVQLAKNGEKPSALRLADALFAPSTGEDEKSLSRRDEYWYKDGLSKVAPVLVDIDAQEFLRRVCGWLDALVRTKEHVRPETGEDYSYWWRPAIEEHEQNRDYDLTGVVVGFLRQGLEGAIRQERLSVDVAFAMLAAHPFLIFKRIRLHLINEFAERDPSLARQNIMNRDLFDDFRYKHEYAMLVGRRFGLLAPVEQETWFAWVDAGPDLLEFEQRLKEEGREVTAEDLRNRSEYWQLEKLHLVREHLEDGRRAFYEQMRAKHGEPELADLNSRMSTGWGGGGSAITVEELTRLSFEEAVQRVSAWVPPKDQVIGHDLEGLAAAFGEYVRASPEAFSVKARALIERPAPYVRMFIGQMAEAVRVGRDVDVLALVPLCRWVLSRPVEESTGVTTGSGALVDKNWRWTRDEISRLAQSIFEAKSEGRPKFPLEPLRDVLWQIVSALTSDPAESALVHDTSKDDPRVHDYLTLGINSSRGKAVEAALEYARWVSNHITPSGTPRGTVPDGFSAMPEFREMLERQMAPENRTVEAMALIGSRAGLIYWIDRDWLATSAGKLFDLEGIDALPRRTQGWAAWNAFLVWVAPHIEFYRLFKSQYAFALSQAAKTDLGEPSREGPMDHLGEHLVLLYGRGQLGLDDDDGLLRRFLSDVNPEIRRHAIGFVGEVLNRESNLPPEFVDRYRLLWEAYWATSGESDAQQKPDARLFGVWFSSGRFAPEWAIARLEEFVEISPTPEPDHAIVEELARIGHVDVPRALTVLERMIQADREGWHVGMWLDSATRVLELAMRAGGEVREKAEYLIDLLGRRGHSSVGELLAIGDHEV